MSQSFDEILAAAQQEQQSKPEQAPAFREKDYDKAAYRERKQSERESVYRLADITAERAAASPETYAAYLNVQARFNRYSVNNALLIAAQLPEATKLATFEEWQAEGVQIRAGAKALSLLGPGKEFERPDGSTRANFNVKKVFDISQTHAVRPQEEIHRDQRFLMRALVNAPPCKLAVNDEKVPANAFAYYSPGDKTVYVRHGLQFDDMFRAVSRELAFAHLDKGSGFSRNELEFRAKSIAFLVCARNRIAPEAVAVPGRFSNQEAKALKKELGEIHDVANSIHAVMDKLLGKPAREAQPDKNPRDRDAR